MQQTEKYKFNIIETSDMFSPDALNANARTAEAQLAALAAQEAADKAALEKTAAANKTALEQALAAQKSAHAADKAALDAAVNALKADVRPGSPGQMVRIATGSYVGKGLTGPDNACRLNFNFKPMLVFVFSTRDQFTHLMMRPGTFSNGASNVAANVTWGEQSVSWFIGPTLIPASQCNDTNVTYSYIAIGVPV